MQEGYRGVIHDYSRSSFAKKRYSAIKSVLSHSFAALFSFKEIQSGAFAEEGTRDAPQSLNLSRSLGKIAEGPVTCG